MENSGRVVVETSCKTPLNSGVFSVGVTFGSGWWFQIFVMFTPIWEDVQFD